MLSHAERKLLQGLARRRGRAQEGLFLAEGVRVVEELLVSSIPVRLAVVSSTLEDSERGRALHERLEALAPTRAVSPAELQRLAAAETAQGVLVAAETPRTSLEALRPGARATLLVLDAVQDPGNVGTLVRTADALDALGVVTLPGTADPWNPKVVRAAAGSLFRRPPVEVTLEGLRRWLDEHGFTLLVAAMDGLSIEKLAPPARSALLVGNEGAGASEEARRAATQLVSVPTAGAAESLNVAVAAGILLYLLTRDTDPS